MNIDVDAVLARVRHNCDISDAIYGGVYSLCGFLLRLRDLYKWEHGVPPWEEPEPSLVIEWVDRRESMWEGLLDEEFQPIDIGGEQFSPFDQEAINERLRPLGLLYGAGYAAAMKPSFFLAELRESRTLGDLRVDIAGRELARDLFTAPAMRRGRQIFARSSCMPFFIWDLIQEGRPSARSALTFALSHYGLDPAELRKKPAELGPKLNDVAAAELETWIFHEVGECNTAAFKPGIWREIVAAHANSPIEAYARVLKDLLADTHEKGLLGHIIQRRLGSSLGFYLAFIRPFTRVLFPEILSAFEAFRADGDWAHIENARKQGERKATDQTAELIRIHQEGAERGHEWAHEKMLKDLIKPLGIPTGENGEDEE